MAEPVEAIVKLQEKRKTLGRYYARNLQVLVIYHFPPLGNPIFYKLSLRDPLLRVEAISC
jgi:hypothetical protein